MKYRFLESNPCVFQLSEPVIYIGCGMRSQYGVHFIVYPVTNLKDETTSKLLTYEVAVDVSKVHLHLFHKSCDVNLVTYVSQFKTYRVTFCFASSVSILYDVFKRH
jgi:hypothetical protein